MNEELPLVTIITPTYNRATFLDETIQSVLSQDYPNIEYIVLDDGSMDNTCQVLEKYNDRIIWESHPNMGENRTVNKGFDIAKGEVICVVNSDDPILPGALRKLVSTLMVEQDALAVYPDWVEIDADSKPIKEMRLPDYDIYNMLYTFNVGMGPGTIFTRHVLEKYGYRDAERKYTGDLEFWFRLAARGKLVLVPEILATHRTHPHSASITDRSSKISEELLSMVKPLFAEGILPIELQRDEKRIMARVYLGMMHYSRKEPGKMIRYFLSAFLSRPITAIYFVFQYTDAKILRLILPEKSFNSLRSWWQPYKERIFRKV